MTKEEIECIEEFVKELPGKGLEPQHGFDHAERVRDNALNIVKYLKIKNIDLNLLQAICLLHDVPITLFKHGPLIKHYMERFAVRKYLPKVLQNLSIKEEDQKIIYRAIEKHNFSIPYGIINRRGDVYAKILQDADTIDFLKPEREESMIKYKKEYYFYFLLSLVSGRYLRYARKHLKKYLNFSELAEYNWFQI